MRPTNWGFRPHLLIKMWKTNQHRRDFMAIIQESDEPSRERQKVEERIRKARDIDSKKDRIMGTFTISKRDV